MCGKQDNEGKADEKGGLSFMKSTKKRLSSLILCLTILAAATNIFFNNEIEAGAANDVTPSTKEYEVELYQTGMFLGNEKGVDVSGGEAVYLTYTVSSVAEDTTTQSGLIATTDREADYPYLNGVMQFNNLQSLLMRPGYTYFIKFEVTEFGFEYVAVYSNGEDEYYETGFIHTTGEVVDNMKYCGIWVTGGDLTAKLTHVHCYDKKGNDLGVAVNGGMVMDSTFRPNSNVQHRYEFTLNDAKSIAISNAKYSKAKEIFMEYEVKDVKNSLEQTGFIMSNSPTALYPYDGNQGYMMFRNIYDGSGGELAIPGAKYLIRFTRTEDGYKVRARYTLDGNNHYIEFEHTIGTYNPKYGYCSIWLGSGNLTSTFFNVKCYDGEGKNLGIQTNQEDLEIIHYGGWEDYSPSHAMYYCKENETLITLNEDCSTKVQNLGTNTSETGNYRIDELTLTMQLGGQTSNYEYAYIYMTDEAGNRYVRLKEYTVKFVTGTEDITKTASVANGYMIEKPEDPTLKGNTFKGWYLGNGTEYTFGSIVTKSQTLYAKWVDGDGNEYLATSAEMNSPERDWAPLIVFGICAVMVLVTAAGVILVIRKGNRNEANK